MLIELFDAESEEAKAQAIMIFFALLAILVGCAAADSHIISWGLDVSHASITVYQSDVITWTLGQDVFNHTVTCLNTTLQGLPLFNSTVLLPNRSV